MKFSVLLPTRDRLKYLGYAVETVRRQDYDDWELIISDNFSTEDIRGYVEGLNDSRIKYYRTDQFVPVTENWNNALERSTGEYVIMLGDDDGLLPGYFTKAKRHIEAFQSPDLLHTGAYNYGYPGAFAEHPDGYLHTYSYSNFLGTATEPFLLVPAVARQSALAVLDFRMTYGLNMQFALVQRKFMESLAAKGPFFQSPFPDYYAMNVLFLKAKRILAVPEPMVVIGVCPKSYGSFLNKNNEGEGYQFLQGGSPLEGSEFLKSVVLPGTNINTSWLYTIDKIKQNYGDEFPIKININRYRMLQTIYVYQKYYAEQAIPQAEFDAFQRKLKPWERLAYGRTFRAAWLAVQFATKTGPGRAAFRQVFRQEPYPQWLVARLVRNLGQFTTQRFQYLEGTYQSVVDVYDRFLPVSSPAQKSFSNR